MAMDAADIVEEVVDNMFKDTICPRLKKYPDSLCEENLCEDLTRIGDLRFCEYLRIYSSRKEIISYAERKS